MNLYVKVFGSKVEKLVEINDFGYLVLFPLLWTACSLYRNLITLSKRF